METQPLDRPRHNPLWSIFWASFWIGFLLLVIYLGVNGAMAALQQDNPSLADEETIQLLERLSIQVAALSREAWLFIRPFLQIIIILVIVEWILGKFGLSVSKRDLNLDWNVQTIIALLVTGAFAIAALSGANTSIGALKDLALVVVGFYFGTQRKTIDLQTGEGKVSIVEEHDNDILVQTKKREEREDEDDTGA